MFVWDLISGSFGFQKKPSILQIKEIESIVRKSISSCHQVLRQDMPFSEAQHIGDLIYSTKEVSIKFICTV